MNPWTGHSTDEKPSFSSGVRRYIDGRDGWEYNTASYSYLMKVKVPGGHAEAMRLEYHG